MTKAYFSGTHEKKSTHKGSGVGQTGPAGRYQGGLSPVGLSRMKWTEGQMRREGELNLRIFTH